MLVQYVVLKSLIVDVHHIDVKRVLLIEHDDQDVAQLLISLHDLNGITLTLEENKTALRLARKLFAW